MSTFHGLEMAKRALSVQQSALYTTGHNISNAHTKGYSRQRVNFTTDTPYPPASKNSPAIPGQLGTGVKAGSVQRIRDQFLDVQYRSENSRAGYWEAQKATLSRMEQLLNEPSDSGLSKTMKNFWQSLGDLAVNPDNSGARSVVKERGIAVAESFNYIGKNLDNIREDLKGQINHTKDSVNKLLSDIQAINGQIERIEPHGHLPNDLYDERDRLVDELSEIVNIQIERGESSGDPHPNAEGPIAIKLVDNTGQPIDDIYLIDEDNETHELEIGFDKDTGHVNSLTFGGTTADLDKINEIGSLKGLIDVYGYDNQPDSKVSLPQLMDELNKMANEFAEAFNYVHRLGEDSENVDEGIIDFFKIDDSSSAAMSIKVNKAIIDKPSLIQASTDDKEGNGENALKLQDVFDKSLKDIFGEDYIEDDDQLEGASVEQFFQSLIGDLGVAAQEANRRSDNTEILRIQVEEQRMSISAVSLDEEMTNMIKFQHAYNAAARSMTSIDEMLDRIINGMGLVGR